MFAGWSEVAAALPSSSSSLASLRPLYDSAEGLETPIQLLYLLALLGFLSVGAFLVVRQVLIRRELDEAAKGLGERIRTGEATCEVGEGARAHAARLGHARERPCAHARSRPHARMGARACTRTRTHAHRHTHAHTRTHTCARTHARTPAGLLRAGRDPDAQEAVHASHQEPGEGQESVGRGGVGAGAGAVRGWVGGWVGGAWMEQGGPATSSGLGRW